MTRATRKAALMFTVCAFAFGGDLAYGDEVNALAEAAVAALKAGNAENADNLSTQALAIGNLAKEDRARVLLNRGLAREQLGRRDEALVDYTAAINENTLLPADRARALFDRGVTLDELGHTSDAIADYAGALKINPNFAAALNNRANAYRRTGKLEDAKRDYSASIAAENPRPEYPQYGLGQIAEAQGDPAAARDWYQKAAAANPNYTLATQRLAALGPVAPPFLKPPHNAVADAAATSDAPVVLRQPVEKPAPAPRRMAAATPTIAPAAYQPVQDAPDLRPAIVEAVNGRKHATASSGASSGAMVQLGAWRAEADAADGWNRIMGQAGDLLNGMTPNIVMADVPGKGRYWRLRTGVVGGISAEDFCARLKAQGIVCLAVH